MIRNSIFSCVCIGAAILGASALAQPGDKGGKKPAAAAPQPGADEMAKMMETWMKAATPGKMHERLVSNAGTWEGKNKMWMAPGAPPTESPCTTVITSMMGGRFTRSETKGNMDMGTGQPMPFEGFGIYGYNNTTEKFESVWCDNFGTLMMNFTGTLSADGKVLTSESHFTCPMTQQPIWMREVETITGPDTMTLEMFGPDPEGKEFKMMEISYKRIAGAPKAESKPAGKPAASK